MNLALSDELLSINAIYASDTLTAVDASQKVFILRIPDCDVSLRIEFPQDYPDHDSPIILGPESSGTETRKGEANEIVSLAKDLLQQCFHVGEPCIYDLIEEIVPKLQQKHDESENDKLVQQNDESAENKQNSNLANPGDEVDLRAFDVDPQWILSGVVTEKKSIFVAHAAHVSTIDEAQLYIQHLVSTDRKVAKATHNISAWRIQETTNNGPLTYQDFDDDGETAAGGRLLHLLQLMDVWNVVVVVSRWYGGVHLGPDRFRIINSVARDAVTKGAFTSSSNIKHVSRGK